MRNIEDRVRHHHFRWDNLGDIDRGRGALGTEAPVLIYRLMQYTMLDVLAQTYGLEQANHLFRQSGFLAGIEFARHMLDLNADFGDFFAQLQRRMRDLKIGILRMEHFDESTGEVTLSIAEDLDCSGLPISDEMVCYYDEGFLEGVLEAYTGRPYRVREVDCWASGDRVCRFQGGVYQPEG